MYIHRQAQRASITFLPLRQRYHSRSQTVPTSPSQLANLASHMYVLAVRRTDIVTLVQQNLSCYRGLSLLDAYILFCSCTRLLVNISSCETKNNPVTCLFSQISHCQYLGEFILHIQSRDFYFRNDISVDQETGQFQFIWHLLTDNLSHINLFHYLFVSL